MVCWALVGDGGLAGDADANEWLEIRAWEIGWVWEALTFICLFRGLVDDGTVLEAAQVEHSYTSVGTTGNEDVYAIGTKADVKNFLIVGNKLCFGSQGGDIPDSAGCIYAGCDDQAW
jgi:hypothetical protein